MISLIVLAIVFILIAIRNMFHIKIEIWKIMLFGAIAVIVTQQISINKAVEAIDVDVILFLFGMFVVGKALEMSGYLSQIAYSLFKGIENGDKLLLYIIFIFAFFSALLVNDTVAIIGTPVILLLAKKYKINTKAALLSLAFAITIGSVTTPIGNPQNFLIAINSNINFPFFTFLKYLLLPTLINLFVLYILIKFFYKFDFQKTKIGSFYSFVKDKKLAFLSKISISIILILVFLKIIFAFFHLKLDFKLTYIAILSALPIIIFSNKRLEIIKEIDWHTLIFFASMFILMESVWETGFFQSLIKNDYSSITSTDSILLISIVLSQFLSNVPLVALYLPVLLSAKVGEKGLMALAAGSTIAGNLSILGAASNVIIIQQAEKKGETITFFDFIKIGLPLTIINALVYWIFLYLIP